MPGGIAEIRHQFDRVFGPGGRVHVIRAPGRVNLIGEHTDYNDGFVLPMAIEPELRIACRARDDGRIRLASSAFPGPLAEFRIDQKITPGEPAWADYSRGVAAQLIGAGIPLVGMDALMQSTIPLGGGLSSSAAIEVATAKALLTLAGSSLDENRLALICQKAEHEFKGLPVGIMDQTIVVSARADCAMLLDCRDLSRQFVPIDGAELRVAVVNSMVHHELPGSPYAERRRQCEEGAAHFRKSRPQVRALRDVTPAQVEAARDELPDVVFRRCRHVVTENARTLAAAAKLKQRDYEELGQLMCQSHESLRTDYEVSTPELDFLAAESMKIKGVYGARMTGGGFGGCIVALVLPRQAEALAAHLKRVYSEQFAKDPAVFFTAAAAGASQLE